MPDAKWFLCALVAAGPLGFVTIEAGWTVTELGRQPWIIYGVMRTAEAVTSVGKIAIPFLVFTLLYVSFPSSWFISCAGSSWRRQSPRPG